MAVAVSPDGRRVAAGGGIEGGKGVVHVWDAATGRRSGPANDHAKEVLAVAFAPDGSSLAAAGGRRAWSRSATPADGLGHANACRVTRAARRRSPFRPTARSSSAAKADGGTCVWDMPDRPAAADLQRRGLAGRGVHDRPADQLHRAQPGRRDARDLRLQREQRVRRTGADLGRPDRRAAARLRRRKDPRAGRWPSRRTARSWRRAASRSSSGTSAPASCCASSSGISSGRSPSPSRRTAGSSSAAAVTARRTSGRSRPGGTWSRCSRSPNAATARLADDWLAYHPDGYYDGSPGIERYLAWRVGDEFQTPETLGPQLHHPERITARAERFPQPYLALNPYGLAGTGGLAARRRRRAWGLASASARTPRDSWMNSTWPSAKATLIPSPQFFRVERPRRTGPSLPGAGNLTRVSAGRM